MGVRFGPEELPWAEAERRAEAGTFPYPVPLLRAMQETRDDEVPSASVLVGCLRQFALKRAVPYYEKPADMLPSVFGTAFHAHMEVHTPHGPGEHRELHLRTVVDTGVQGHEAVEVRGTCDYLHEGMLVRDWKSKRYLPTNFQPPRTARAQVNIYNWLAWRGGYAPAQEGELVYVSQSWLQSYRFPLVPLADTGHYVMGRLRHWAVARSRGALPPPVASFFAPVDAKGRKPVPCGYCPVRDACMAAYREEHGDEYG